MSIFKIKKIISFSLLMLFLISLVFPFFASAEIVCGPGSESGEPCSQSEPVITFGSNKLYVQLDYEAGVSANSAMVNVYYHRQNDEQDREISVLIIKSGETTPVGTPRTITLTSQHNSENVTFSNLQEKTRYVVRAVVQIGGDTKIATNTFYTKAAAATANLGVDVIISPLSSTTAEATVKVSNIPSGVNNVKIKIIDRQLGSAGEIIAEYNSPVISGRAEKKFNSAIDNLKVNNQYLAVAESGTLYYGEKLFTTSVATLILTGTAKSPISIGEFSKITVTTSDKQAGVVINFTNPDNGSLDKTTCTTVTGGSCDISFSASEEKMFAIGFNAPHTNYKVGALTINVVKSAAKTETDYYLLAPIPGLGECTPDPVTGKEVCKVDTTKGFGSYLNMMIQITIGIAAVLAMIMIVMGGIEYMTSELVSSKESGKKKVTNAVLGLLLALGAFAILNTINPDLLNIGLSNLPVATIIIPDDDMPQTAINGKFCTNTAGANGGYEADADWATIAGNEAQLSPGISVKASSGNTDCKKVGEQGCTSIRGLVPNFVNSIKTNCPSCDVIILTAGTECWLHGGSKQSTNHHPNSGAVDLSMTPSLGKFFTDKDNFIKADGKSYTKNGLTCKAEINSNGDHWHCDGGGAGTSVLNLESFISISVSKTTPPLLPKVFLNFNIDPFYPKREHKFTISSFPSVGSPIRGTIDNTTKKADITNDVSKLVSGNTYKINVTSAGINIGTQDLIWQ